MHSGKFLLDQTTGAGLPCEPGEHGRKVGLGASIDILQRLASSATSASLFDAMLDLALGYSQGQHARILANAGDGYRTLASAGNTAVDADGASAASLARLAVRVDATGEPRAVDHEGRIGVAVWLPLPGDGKSACLCMLQQAMPSQECLDKLALIAACGGALLPRLADAHLILAAHLAGERSLLRTLIDNMPDQIYVKDVDGRFVLANTAAATCIGVDTPDELVGKCDLELFPGEYGEKFHRDEQAIIQSGIAIVDQLEENINQAGVRRWFSTTKVPYQDNGGRVIGIVGMSRDVTLRVAADEAIRLRNRAIESSLDAIVISNCLQPGNPVIYVNPAFERITGFSFDEATQGGIERLLSEDGEPAPEPLRQAMLDQCEGRAVLQSRRKDNGLFWNEVRVAPVRDLGGRATHFVYTMSDITKARDSEEQLERLASHDVLTGLPNRRMLMDRLGQAVAMGERGNFVVAVAFIDLDRLKLVNDSFGHEAGDALLKTVAGRMASCMRKSDTVARLGGDEFVLVSLHSPAHAAPGDYSCVHDMLVKVQHLLAEPIIIGDAPFSATCSIGVAIYPQHGCNAETLLKHADEAMYLAKKNGRNKIEFYTGE